MTTSIEMVYAGAVRHDGKVVHAYYHLKNGQLEDRAQVYPTSLGDFPPGAMCMYQVNEAGAVSPVTAEFIEMWRDKDAVVEWTTRHNAMAASAAAWRAQMSDSLHCLSPIRGAYKCLDEEQQGVLLAQVVRYIVNGMTEENGHG